MARRWLGILAVLALLVGTGALAAAQGARDPDGALREINQWVTDQVRQARDSNKPVDVNALRKGQADRAREAVKGVDPQTVEAAKGLAWAQLFDLAGMPGAVTA